MINSNMGQMEPLTEKTLQEARESLKEGWDKPFRFPIYMLPLGFNIPKDMIEDDIYKI